MTDTQIEGLELRAARREDAPLILSFIRALAEYEKLPHEVVATEEGLAQALFDERQIAEVVLAFWEGEAAGIALYFHNFSTFVGRPGLYLEDLFVKPEMRGHGIGRALLRHLAAVAVERNCGRMEWSVLDWNEPAIGFYKSIGAVPMNEWTVYRLSGPALAGAPHGTY